MVSILTDSPPNHPCTSMSLFPFVTSFSLFFVVSPRLPPFFSASIREGRVAVSVDHPRGTHSRYVIGCCLIPFGICGVKNNSRRITYGIGYVWRMPSLSPLFSLAVIRNFVKTSLASKDSKYAP